MSGEGDRGVHMGLRLRRTSRERGVAPDGVRLVHGLHGVAMEPRREALADDHDPDFLHPGRTALVLLLDAGVTEPAVLCAALLRDTRRPELEPPAPAVEGWARARAQGGVAAVRPALELAAAVPSPADDSLAETLVVGSDALRLVALAERLDHLRHAHLHDDPSGLEEAWERARDVYLPVAARTHPVLERRYAWWVRTFAPGRG